MTPRSQREWVDASELAPELNLDIAAHGSDRGSSPRQLELLVVVMARHSS